MIHHRLNRPRMHTAFTLIELLVVVSIIAMLIGILLPVLAGARDQARMVKEMSAARQLTMAYTVYSTDHHGDLLPGYARGSAWDGRGHPVKSPASDRYPWRLAPYLDYDMRGSLLVNKQEESLWHHDKSTAPFDWYYRISVFPSMGLNMNFLGGNRISGSLPLYISNTCQAVHPSRQIVFGSAHYNVSGSNEHGYHEIRPPNYLLGPGGGWSDHYDSQDSAFRWGFVEPRWHGKAVFGFLDGHAGLLGTEKMRDMTYWSPQAQRQGNSKWRPTLP